MKREMSVRACLKVVCAELVACPEGSRGTNAGIWMDREDGKKACVPLRARKPEDASCIVKRGQRQPLEMQEMVVVEVHAGCYLPNKRSRAG